MQCVITAILFLGPWFEPVALTYLLLPIATILALKYRFPSTAFTNVFIYAFVIASAAVNGDMLLAETALLQFQFVILFCATLLIGVSARQKTATLAGVQQSESRYRNIAQLSADWHWQQDESLRFTVVSEQTPGSSGFDQAEMIGKTRLELPITWSSELEKNQHLQTLLAREPFRDVVLQTPGNHFTLISGEPVFDDDGGFCGYRGVGRDISDIKRVQESAERSRQFFVDLVNNVPNAISVKDEKHRYLEVNEAFCQMVDARREQIIGSADHNFANGEMAAKL